MSEPRGPTREALVTRYRTIVADPPWRYRKDGRDRVGDRSYGGGVMRWAEQHYQTMGNAEIRDLPVGDLADVDAHLYLWVTSPRLYGERNDRSISPADIMAAWGFTYTTALVWVKTPGLGLGSYYRVNTEFCLFGVKGRCPVPPELREVNVITTPFTNHSAKPDASYDLFERVSPAPRIELFARRARLGWDTWGDQALHGTEAMSA